MTKANLKLLERIFAAEIEGRLPAQIKSKRLEILKNEGYVEQVTEVLQGRFPVTIKGWVLTPLGHHTYCASCK